VNSFFLVASDHIFLWILPRSTESDGRWVVANWSSVKLPCRPPGLSPPTASRFSCTILDTRSVGPLPPTAVDSTTGSTSPLTTPPCHPPSSLSLPPSVANLFRHAMGDLLYLTSSSHPAFLLLQAMCYSPLSYSRSLLIIRILQTFLLTAVHHYCLLMFCTVYDYVRAEEHMSFSRTPGEATMIDC
jgi:hypothetical protein